jgi:phosphoribosylamine--glycine ligase
MITEIGARVLEFNCRFGDPETQTILPRMKSDLLPQLQATIDGKIDQPSLSSGLAGNQQIEWDERASVTVVMASGGYPDKYEVGKTISGLDDAAQLDDVQIFHAGTKRSNNAVVTAGGRVLAVTALGSTIESARNRAYEAVQRIHFEGCHFRSDIAMSAIAR